MESDFEAVQRLFSSENGVAVRMDAILSPHLSADGAIAQRNQSLDQRTKRLQDDQVALDARMKVIEQRYLKQFTALDGLLSQLQSTSLYLGQQLANLPKIGKE
jgi:flagellar hook-associated protein 2